MAQIGQMYYRIPSSSGYLTAETKRGTYNPYEDLIGQIRVNETTQLTKVGVQAAPGTQMVLNQLKQIMIGRTGIYELDEDIAITELYFIRPQNYIRNTEAEQVAIEEGLNGINDAMEVKENAYKEWTFLDESSLECQCTSWLEIQTKLETYKTNLQMTNRSLTTARRELESLKLELNTLVEGTVEYQRKAAEIRDKENQIATLTNNAANYRRYINFLQERVNNKTKMQEIEDAYLAAYEIARARYHEGINGIYMADTPGDLENVIIDYIME